MLNTLKWILNPDQQRLMNLFNYYNIEFDRYNEKCYNDLIKTIKEESISLENITKIKQNLSDVKFVASAKDFFIKHYIRRSQKIVTLKLQIDAIASKEIGHSPKKEMCMK